MAKRRPRPGTGAKPRAQSTSSVDTPSPGDKESVDGILVQIKKADFTVAGEQPDSIQKLPGYEIHIAIPDWDKNRSLLDPVRKAHHAQQKLLAKLRGNGTSRPWMIERFNQIDKVVAATLTTIAERIRTRRWRERERGKALERLKAVFDDLLRWTAKTTRYCQRAAQCTDPAEKEIILDAACLGILKVGELVNRVERMQHGFWQDFSAAHFLDVRHKRNLIGHTDDLEGEDAIPLGTGIVQDLHTAIRGTLISAKAGASNDCFLMSVKALRELKPVRPGDKPTPGDSIAMIRLDENNRFVINRVGRSHDNKLLFSSSVTGRMNVKLWRLG